VPFRRIDKEDPAKVFYLAGYSASESRFPETNRKKKINAHDNSGN
jgi:hypothetical protein